MILLYSEWVFQHLIIQFGDKLILMENDLTALIKKDLAIDLPDIISIPELEKLLSVYVNDLIQHNFQQLITLLYRIDVNETKLRKLLQEHTNETAGNILAKLIIERQIQKIKTRQQFNQAENDISEEEKW